jgi:thioredoxin-like negative regulator of GroEL
MLITNYLRTFALTTALVAAVALAQTPYDEGQKALREQNWTEAAEHFQQAIKADRKTADASMYWRAHALYKAGRNKEAERQVSSLERKYPDSRWVKEAQVLIIEHEGSEPVLAGETNRSELDDELRMFALARLMEHDPERALPLVMDMIEKTDSEKVRNDMLFLLGMSDSPEAQQQIARIARDSNNPRLQADAIHMLGIASDQPSMALLSELYRESDSVEVKEAVIQAHIVSDEPGTLVEILKMEKNPRLQVEIIHALGVMDATSDLDKIYPTLTDRKTRIAALEAFSIAGDTSTLRRVLDTETDAELRKAAIHGIAMEDDSDAAEVLTSVYDNASSIEEKKVVLESLVMMDDAEELALKIVRTEQDPGLRKEAIHILGVMGATDEIAGLYATIDEVELRKAVLNSMMIAEDTDGLIRVLKTETDPELRSAAIQALAISDEKAAADYLVSLYPNGSRDEKQAVIQSMMIMDHAEGLVELLKMETDPDRRREILQMLTMMDSDVADDYLFEMLEQKG